MKNDNLLIMGSDKQYARQRMATLQKEIDALGSEFNDAFTQTSETWHDNAPFEIVRDRQAVLYAEHQGLKGILQSSLPSVPAQNKKTIGIGAYVEVVHKNRYQQYFVAGDWTPFAGKQLPGTGAVIISREAPIAKLFVGLGTGDSFTFNRKDYAVTKISYDLIDQYAQMAGAEN